MPITYTMEKSKKGKPYVRSVTEGQVTVEDARDLVVAVHTVESALTRIYRKLGVRSRSELALRFAGRPGGSVQP